MIENNNYDKQEENQPKQNDANKIQLYLWVFVALLFLLASFALGYCAYTIFTDPSQSFFENKEEPSDKTQQSKDEISSIVPRLIDGVLTSNKNLDIFPLAIVIDNHPDSRPSHGLAEANLVIEAEVEGGLTRYLAFFADGKEHTEIGPVRSARPYFVDWVREYSALYTHVGGSPAALVKLKKENILHINEFYNEHKFWRDTNYSPPHNVFTSTSRLHGYIEERNKTHSPYFSWQYKDDLALDARPDAPNISIAYPIGHVSWQYDKKNNQFNRLLSNRPHLDASGEAVTAKNVIIQIISAREIDEKLRLEMNVIGSGEAIICLDGACIPGRWKKKNASARTRYYIENDNEIKLNRGTTWVEVVRPERKVIY